MTNFEKLNFNESNKNTEHFELQNSKLDDRFKEIVFKELPENLNKWGKKSLVESIPKEGAPGSSYLAIWEFSDGRTKKWAFLEISLSGSLHVSKTERNTGETHSGKSTVLIYDSLTKLLDPLELIDTARIRLGEKIRSIIPDLDADEETKEKIKNSLEIWSPKSEKEVHDSPYERP